ncbi:MAG: valine--tRNA ligase [Actinomycetota bacterium]|nr:valine--tRNA ligase [Actinomycetota bacterium]
MSKNELSKGYEPNDVESKWYEGWLKEGYFTAEADPSKESFTIVIPPPNVTGSLHMGHALNNTIQDILIRKARMEGKAVLWLPGTDHAGIATQNVVEKELAKEGLTKEDLGRDGFIERVWKWKEEYGSTIIGQLKRMGCSCDWSRERFTMDELYSTAVKKVFVDLYQDGLIYRGNRIINWCPRCLTALSDIEVEHEDTEGYLWHIKYPVKGAKDHITVATTRPETMLGDVAVAIHPDDPRYKKYIGATLILPVVGREILVIADEAVEMGFGTGAVKVTPAHDMNDFEMGERHGLEMINIFTPNAKINEDGGAYLGLDRYSARKAILKDLEEAGFLDKSVSHSHTIGKCYRCHTVIEPYLSDQWFVKMRPLAEPAIEAVKEGRIVFSPRRWEKVYFDWMENIKDWCISRQLWWGHQIPAWYCECGAITVTLKTPSSCSTCGSSELIQDEDVLDTWFSSALWPFATMGWPSETEDLKFFYPTSVLSTARDIIYLWVARMNMMGLKFMGDVPYKTVIVHPTVMTIDGKRMSKSLGTGVDPLDLIEKYGTDATRFGLIIQSQAQDMRFSEEKLEMSRNFVNKIWNGSRLVIMNMEGYSRDLPPEFDFADRWILSKFSSLIEGVESDFKSYNLSHTAKRIYDFFWGEFCDWYLEISKESLYSIGEDGKTNLQRNTVQSVLWTIMESFLRLMHPFMPFVTEEIWARFEFSKESIMISDWPSSFEFKVDSKLEDDFELVQKIIVAIRSIRASFSIPPSKSIEVRIECEEDLLEGPFASMLSYIKTLANVETVKIGRGIEIPAKSAVAVEGPFEIHVLLEGLIDIDLEKERLSKRLGAIEDDLKVIGGKLKNQSFIEKAPKEIVAKEEAKEAELLYERDKLLGQLGQLGS